MDPSISELARASGNLRRLARLVLPLAFAIIPRCAPAAGSPPWAPQGGGGHILPMIPPGATPSATPANAHLDYYGGPVISNVEVIMVLWGSGTFEPFVQETSSPSVATFYGGVTNSPYLDWLTEYDTSITAVGGSAGTGQTIGRGTYLGQFTIAPSAANDGATIDDTNIQAELVAQIDAGHLPASANDGAGNVNTIYMLFFPQGKTITLGKSTSCQTGGFCAYHSTLSTSGHDVYYGVHPDMSAGSGCNTGCGNDPMTFNNQTSVASHELVEAVTDAAVGLAVNFAPPLAWYDINNNMEIGDLCNAQHGTITGGDGVTYTVQKEWSNTAGNCIVARTATNDFSIAVDPPSRLLARGSSAAYTVSTALTSGAAQTIAFSVPSLPAGLTATFSPTSTSAGGSSTLTLAASGAAALQTTVFTITGTAASGPHTTVASVTVLPALSISPTSTALAPRATLTFTASGGTGTGYGWSLPANASGGTIDASTGAYRAGPVGSVTDVVRATDSAGNAASVDVTVTAAVSISPGTATLAPGATQTFTASGGSGAGYAWSLATDASGGAIDAATGAYKAGPTGSVTDVVQVADSLGNVATAGVTVTAAPPPPSTSGSSSSHGCGCGAGGVSQTGLLALGALLFAPRRRKDSRSTI